MNKQQFKDASEVDGVRISNEVLQLLPKSAFTGKFNLTSVTKRKAIKKVGSEKLQQIIAKSRTLKFYTLSGNDLLIKDGNTINHYFG